MRIVLVRFLVSVCAFMAAPALACERAIERKDIFVDVNDDEVSVVVINADKRCSLRISDWLRTKPGDEDEFPEALSTWVALTDGTVLSSKEPCITPGWHGSREKGYLSPESLRATRLAPGEVRIKRVKIWRLLDGLDYERTVACGRRGLPWGYPVTLRISVVLPLNAFDGEDWPPEMPGPVLEFVTHPFQFTLPATPVTME